MESYTHQAEIVDQFTRQARPFADNKAHSENRSLEVFRELGCFSGKERLLDSGCGPGLVSIYLAPFVGEVVGVDLTPAMIELASETAKKASLSNVTFLEGNMAMLPFPDDHFDVSISRYAFHHLENPKAAFEEMLRVTRPGGKIIILDVTPEPEKRENYDRFERLRDLSHISALVSEELRDLGEAHGLSRPEVIQFGLEMDARQLINSSFPESVIPSFRDKQTLMAQGFWCVARRKTDGYLEIPRRMTTQPRAKRTSQKVQLSMKVGISREQLISLLTDDVGKDTLSFQMRAEENSLTMTFPLTAAAWAL